MQTSLIIDKTESSPEIIFNPAENIFSIKGRSYMEDSTPFYKSVILWIKEYSKKPNKETIFLIDLEYINSTTTKHLVRIFMNLENIVENGYKAKIIWKYSKEDDLMLQRGYELDHAINVLFEIQSY